MTAPFCKDCRHFEKPIGRPRCHRNSVLHVDPTDGSKAVTGSVDARIERQGGSWFEHLFGHRRCGPEGRLFEPKARALENKFDREAHDAECG